MTQEYPNLFSPIRIANHTYRNRILAAPMLATYGQLIDGTVTEALLRIFESRARGGCAEVVIGETPVNGAEAPADGILYPEDIDYNQRSGRMFDAFRRYVDVIKKHDALALIQLFHSGNARNPLPIGKPNPLGPVGYVREDGVTVEAFNAETMQKVRDDFVTCARFMQAVGFDGILIHGAHGFLFTQFLSPATNRRTDAYGGSLENRGRFPREILGDIRQNLGPGFIVELRINGSDRVEGGSTNEQMAEFCSTLDGLVDIIHVSTGLKNVFSTYTFNNMYTPHGLNADLAANIKKRTPIPVTVVGGINSPELAESIIAEGKADFVSLARQMYADPEFANKARSGRAAEIRGCLRCFHCLSGPPKDSKDDAPILTKSPLVKLYPDGYGWSRLHPTGSGYTCTVNPKASKAFEIENIPAPQSSRRVLVVGGGPAGMQAAITAADRGHQVTLAEKEAALGGVLRFTDTDIHKVDLRNFKDLLVREVTRRDIRLMLNTGVTPELLAELAPEAVILAVGASPAVPPISGIGTAVHALDVYRDDSRIGKRVVMVGGGLAGCETALHLADTGHEVTIVEMRDELAPEEFGMAKMVTLSQIEQTKNITVETGAKCLEITPRSVKVEYASGGGESITGDTVVYSLGMNARREQTENLRAAAGRAAVFEAGDCVRSAKVYEAVSEGFMAAMQVF